VFIASAATSALAAQEPRITRIPPSTTIAPGRFGFFSNEPRAIIGVSTTNAATSRDTLGILVSTVRAGSPAERAGIEEGSRIASINGVDLSGRRANDDAKGIRTSAVSRLERELGRAKPGDEVDLRVYFNGQYKNLKVKTVSSADLPRRNRTVSIMGGDN